MNKIQIQITEIDNGFIVAINTQTPTAQYCENLEAIKMYLEQIWPRKVKQSNLNIV